MVRNRRRANRPTNKDSLRRLWKWFLPDDGIFSEIRFHGNIRWTPTHLVWLALCWAWADARFLTDAFVEALGVCETMLGATPLSTYQGFAGAAVAWTPKLMPVLRVLLQRRMEQVASKFWRIAGWVPIAFDGSRSSAPRTRSNEAALCAENYGRGKTAKYGRRKSKGMRRRRTKEKKAAQEPQVWITMMWHMGLRLPWSWRLGPTDSSERAHVMDMVQTQTFPERTLFCGDAGFVGYPLWSCLLEQGNHFLVRVGGNLTLLLEQAKAGQIRCLLQKEGKQRYVLCWPAAAQRAEQRPLRLRLLRVRVGKTSAWLLTSVLDPRRLSVALALRLYKMRWGVEVEFRGLKQTLDRAKLRSRNADRLLTELDWSILAMAVAELLALKEQQKPKTLQDPSKRSLAATMRALRGCMRQLHEIAEPGKDLASRLRAALVDSYRRTTIKGARYRPKNPDKKPLGDPTMRSLTRDERCKLKQIEAKMAA